MLLGTLLLALLGGGALLLALITDVPATASSDSVAEQEAIVRRFYAAVNDAVRTGDLSLLDDVAVTHTDRMPGAAGTRCDLRCRVSALHRLDPDVRLRVDDVLVDGDRVVARLSIQTSDRPALLGLPLHGTLAPWAPVDFLRVADGRIVELQPARDLALVESLGRATLESVPPAPYRLGLVRLNLQPGTTIPDLSAGGAMILLVERGTLVVQVDQPSWVQRAGLTHDPEREERLAAGTIPLFAGERIVLDAATGYTLRSTGSEDAVVLCAAALAGDGGPTNRWIRARSLDEILFNPAESESVAQSGAPISWPSGVRSELIADGTVKTRPVASATLELTRLTLSSHADLPIHDTPGSALLLVETGSAVVDLIAGDAAVRPRPQVLQTRIGPQASSSARLPRITQGGNALFQPGVSAGVRTVESEPLVLLILTVEPGPGESLRERHRPLSGDDRDDLTKRAHDAAVSPAYQAPPPPGPCPKARAHHVCLYGETESTDWTTPF
jgi:predicted ester cyclase